MDICLISTEDGTHIRASSVHGILWLQTHFEELHWEAIATDLVKIPRCDAEVLARDAEEAGISSQFLPALSTASQL